MPGPTIEDLFALRANRSIEALIEFGTFSFERAQEALIIRYGFSAAELRPVLGAFIGRVQDAMRAADLIAGGQTPLDVEWVTNPSLPEDYAYTVVASLYDPRNPEHPVEVPWTVYSPRPLTADQISTQAILELNDFSGSRDSLIGGGSPDLRTRDRRFRELVRDEYGGQAEPVVSIAVAYKRTT